VCVCSLSYPARKAHAPYYNVICGLSDSSTLPHIISSKARLSEKELLSIIQVFWCFLQVCCEIFLILRRTAPNMITNVHRSSCKVPLLLVRRVLLLLLLLLLLVRCALNWNFVGAFRKNITMLNFLAIYSVRPKCFMQTDRRTHGRADRHEEANSRF
jgi:hypothetical protein